MASKMVGIAFSNSSRDTLLQLTDDMKEFKPDRVGPVLKAQVASGEAFRCCTHSWTATHDKLLLKAHKYFIRTHHDGSKKFLLPEGWKRVQEKFKLMDQHFIGLNNLQSRFFAINKGITELPKIILYRIWSEPEDTLLSSLYEEIMSVERPYGKKVFLDPDDYIDIQQSMWYYLKCCPEMDQIESRLRKFVTKNFESKA